MSKTDRLPWFAIILNTVAFALGFSAWVLFGPSIRVIAGELHISSQQAALVKSLPILVGATARIPLGIITDRLGARKMFPALLAISAAAALASSFSTSFRGLVLGGMVLGLVGATFTVGVQSVSSWTPKVRQGLALGIFGAGNIGTALTTFGVPLLMLSIGWRGVFRVYALVLLLMAVVYAVSMRNAPRAAGAATDLRTLLAPLREARTWRFGLYYAATFGVFVATTLTLADVYIDGYGLSMKTAALLTTTFTFSASLVRIVGGGLADRFGARPVLRAAFVVIIVCLAPIAVRPPLAATVGLVFAAGIAMGIGMAASFKYIPQYYASSVGAVGGVVGAIGGLGGFLLPILGAVVRSRMGTPLAGLLPFVGLAVVAAAVQYVAVRAQRGAPAPRVAVPAVAAVQIVAERFSLIPRP